MIDTDTHTQTNIAIKTLHTNIFHSLQTLLKEEIYTPKKNASDIKMLAECISQASLFLSLSLTLCPVKN